MWELRLKDVMSRETALEVAYNPNDCVEQRWGAASGGEEAATCRSPTRPKIRWRKCKGIGAGFTIENGRRDERSRRA